MAVTSLGVGSGLDLSSIVSGLMKVEEQRLTALETKQTKAESRISALGTLKSSLTKFQTAVGGMVPATGQTAISKFATSTATSGDTSLFTATASSSAVAGSYTLSNIVTAKADQIRLTGATLPSVAGRLSITVGSGSAVDIDVAAPTSGTVALSDIASAINSNTSVGVSAAVINDGSTEHLVLTSKNTGVDNAIVVEGSATGNGPEWDVFDYTRPGSGTTTGAWTVQQTARSAQVEINGLPVTSTTNSFTSAITGVSFNLLKDSTTGSTLNITQDNNKGVLSALEAFVSAYNSTAETTKQLGYYDASTKTAGKLQGDATLRTTQSQLRNLLLTTTSTGATDYQTLTDIGVSITVDGTLTLDAERLKKATTANFSAVASIVSNVGSAYKSNLESILDSEGSIASATESANLIVKELERRQESMSLRLDTIEARYIKQFTALDTLIAGMNSTSSFLTQQINSLSNSK